MWTAWYLLSLSQVSKHATADAILIQTHTLAKQNQQFELQSNGAYMTHFMLSTSVRSKWLCKHCMQWRMSEPNGSLLGRTRTSINFSYLKISQDPTWDLTVCLSIQHGTHMEHSWSKKHLQTGLGWSMMIGRSSTYTILYSHTKHSCLDSWWSWQPTLWGHRTALICPHPRGSRAPWVSGSFIDSQKIFGVYVVTWCNVM